MDDHVVIMDGEEQPRKMLRNKQNSKSVDLLDFGHSEEIDREAEEVKSSKVKSKSFVRFNNSGVIWNNLDKKGHSRSLLKSQQQ